MGRGRAKAKQAKVARKLKYASPPTDFDQLQRELSSSEQSRGGDLLEDERAEYDDDAEWDDEYE